MPLWNRLSFVSAIVKKPDPRIMKKHEASLLTLIMIYPDPRFVHGLASLSPSLSWRLRRPELLNHKNCNYVYYNQGSTFFAMLCTFWWTQKLTSHELEIAFPAFLHLFAYGIKRNRNVASLMLVSLLLFSHHSYDIFDRSFVNLLVSSSILWQV